MAGTPTPDSVSTKLQRIAALARQMPGVALRTLAHHIDVDFLREAHRRTRKEAAPGVDGQTAVRYAEQLEGNLQALLDRAKSGRYRAPAVRRVHIPRGSRSGTRPIGIPTHEDKVLQRAVAMVLGAVYEQDFLDCSYGFRPGRSAHQALTALRDGVMSMGGGWVLELDIERFFDTLDRSKLREMLRRRVQDGVLRRLVGKWLKAGVLDEGAISYPEAGTPQGGVLSPLLANVFLHEVLDTWFEFEVKPRLRGRAFLVRYADDAVLVFACEEDARRVVEVLPKRFERYGLRLHREKTRQVPFACPARSDGSGGGRPGTFDFLGFTHLWRRSRRGGWVVHQKTARDRFCRVAKAMGRWCRWNRHLPVREQHRMLVSKLRGHYAYYGLPGNAGSLSRLRNETLAVWRKWLSRRSHQGRLSWEQFGRLKARYPLPFATIAVRPRPLVAYP